MYVNQEDVVKKVCVPNFFIVGAAKSATTSLYHYLNQHSDVFLCAPKEPKFFTRKHSESKRWGPSLETLALKPKSVEGYLELFKEGVDNKIVGEASVDYLFYYDEAIAGIKSVQGQPKILINLRNPVDRAYSNYTHMVRDGHENLDFLDAIKRSVERAKVGNFYMMALYESASRYYDSVRAYIEAFERENVYVSTYEQFREKPVESMKAILDFLEIDHMEFDFGRVYNASGVPKNGALHRLLMGAGGWKRCIKCLLPSGIRCKLKLCLRDLNLERGRLSSSERTELAGMLCDDVRNLEELLGRRLGEWSDFNRPVS